MTEQKAELMAKSPDGRALLARMGLKANPKKDCEGPAPSEEQLARLLAQTAEGKQILIRRGYSGEQVEQMARNRTTGR
jgi:hypothetical protein